MWVKPTSEMSFLYGNHLLKSGLGRITENTPANQGVVVYSMSDVPLGFGVAAKSTQDCRKLDPSSIVVGACAIARAGQTHTRTLRARHNAMPPSHLPLQTRVPLKPGMQVPLKPGMQVPFPAHSFP